MFFCAATAGAVAGITVGAIVTALVLAGAAFAAYKKLEARHKGNNQGIIPTYNDNPFYADSESPFARLQQPAGFEGAGKRWGVVSAMFPHTRRKPCDPLSQPHGAVAVTIPTATVTAAHAADKPKPSASSHAAPGATPKSVGAAPVKAAVAAAKHTSLRPETPVSHDEGMAIGFTGEELSSALRNVQHAVAQQLIFAVEDSPLTGAGEHVVESCVSCYVPSKTSSSPNAGAYTLSTDFLLLHCFVYRARLMLVSLDTYSI
jgi:hypothetical protein